MPRTSPYTAEQKLAIMAAVIDARKSGKKWMEAFDAAKGAGFKGGLPYLKQMASASGGVKRRRRASRPKVAVMAARRGPGRPKANVNGAGLSDIDKIVAAMVERRVGAAVAKAVRALEQAAKELKRM